MPRVYKPSSNKMYKRYNKSLIELALKEYKNTNKSLAEISKEYNVTKSVLYRHNKFKMKKPGGQPALPLDEEELLLEYIILSAKDELPLKINKIQSLIKEFLDRMGLQINRFKDNRPGPDYVISFLNRHTDKLSTLSQNTEYIEKAVTDETIDDFVINAKNILEAKKQLEIADDIAGRTEENATCEESQIEFLKVKIEDNEMDNEDTFLILTEPSDATLVDSNHIDSDEYLYLKSANFNTKLNPKKELKMVKRKIIANNYLNIKSSKIDKTFTNLSSKSQKRKEDGMCCIKWCQSTKQDKPDGTSDITLYRFPKNNAKRKQWISIVGEDNINFTKAMYVCSLHFQEDSFRTISSTVLCDEAVPCKDILVCRMCLATGVKLLCMKQYQLEKAYELLTGIWSYNETLPHKLCVQCTQKLINFQKLREKTLKAHSLMVNLIISGKALNMKNIRSIDREKNNLISTIEPLIHEPNHCEEHIIEEIEENCNSQIENNDELTDYKEKETYEDDIYMEPEYLNFVNEDLTDTNTNNEIKNELLDENEINDDNLRKQNRFIYLTDNTDEQTSNDSLTDVNVIDDKRNLSRAKILESKARREIDEEIKKKFDVAIRKRIKRTKKFSKNKFLNSKKSFFKCIDCLKCFSDSDAYNRHMIKHHIYILHAEEDQEDINIFT